MSASNGDFNGFLIFAFIPEIKGYFIEKKHTMILFIWNKYERNRIFHLCRDMFDFYGQTLLSTTKLSILAGFTWLLILYKIQDGGQDGNHVWWERLSIEGIVSKYCDISKTQKMGSINPPPPLPLYHSGGTCTCMSEG